MTDPSLQLVIAAALAILLASAGLHKLRNAHRFDAQLAAYRLLPSALVTPAGRLLGATELVLALALLMPDARPAAALATAVLLLGYGAAMGINLARGRTDIDCGCGDAPQPLSGWLLVRNGVLAGAALSLTLADSGRTLGWMDLLLGVPSLLTLMVTYLAVEQLFANNVLDRSRRRTSD